MNDRALRVDPTRAGAFILSHGHQDHYVAVQLGGTVACRLNELAAQPVSLLVTAIV